MSINQGTDQHKTQPLGWFPQLTLVQWALPNPFPRAGDITPPLGKVSLPLLWGEGYGFSPPILLPLQLPDDIGCVSSLETTPHESEAFSDKFEFGGEHVLLLY